MPDGDDAQVNDPDQTPPSEPGPGTPPSPPVAKRVPAARDLHGETVLDEYAWLRDLDTDPDVRAYLEAENAYADATLALAAGLIETVFGEIRDRWQETDRSAPVRSGPWWYFTRTFEGASYPVHCRAPGPDDGDPGEQVILDENRLAEGHDHLACGVVAVSPDHRLLAFSTDFDGSEVFTLRFRDLGTGDDLPDVVEGVSWGGAWSTDNRTFLYSLPDPAMRPFQVKAHRLGTPTAEDVLVAQEDDERFVLGVGLTRSKAYLVLVSGSRTTTEIRVLPADDPTAEPRLIEPRRDGVEYGVEHQGDRFLVLTNDEAPEFRLVSAPVAEPGAEQWTEVLPGRPDVRLDDVDAFAGHVVVTERSLGIPRLRVLDTATGAERLLTFDEPVYEVGPAGNPEYDTSTFRFGYVSLTTPDSVYEEDLDTGDRVLRKRRPVRGGYDPAAYVSERQWAPAADGTLVPLSIVRRRDTPVDGSAPCVLYGYGSYEASIPPHFSPARLSLLDRGVVYAIAHVRGGGELGRSWYEDGKLDRKANSFDDFLAAADHLVARGYADPDRLAARGASAGGLLVAAAVARRPDRFRAVVAEVPFVDVVNTMLDASLPLTVGEWEEWGDPREPADYAWIRSWTPYENVTATPYPALFVTTGINDPRVGFWEPAKWVARIRATTTGDRRVVLRTELGAGHGGPTGRYDAWRDEARVIAFLLVELGVEAG